jgi:cellulose synthase/poly-beta-1,6-N-acetylglucosamine synthase-like glycosyltransferase
MVFLVAAGAALATLAYTYLGYPLVLGLLARLFPRRGGNVGDAAWTPMVSALIPVYNAAGYLPAKLDSLLALDWPADRLEVLVYSDGASDSTCAIARDYAARDPRVKLIVGEQRRGKPTAVNTMRPLALGEVLLMTDVRQPLDRGSLRALVRRLAPEEVATVSGNLVLPTSAGAGVYWRYENWLRNTEARFRSMLGVTGPIYVVRKADLAPLPEDLIVDDMWIPLRLRLAGRALLFADDAIAHDQAFDDEREFGRKVRTLAGQYQLLARLPALLWPWSNPSWFEFMSHKILRLVCPWALLTLFFALPLALWDALQIMGGHPQRLIQLLLAACVGQLGFYALALAGARFGKLGTVARTFVVLNAAALVGLWRQLRGGQRVTW